MVTNSTGETSERESDTDEFRIPLPWEWSQQSILEKAILLFLIMAFLTVLFGSVFAYCEKISDGRSYDAETVKASDNAEYREPAK